ncbi:hypothetical protein CEP53_005112 [Fusarium sp. AF-6]|nr:hypothetical protein CEP53_005112 [Fusarium sp. AF-6]
MQATLAKSGTTSYPTSPAPSVRPILDSSKLLFDALMTALDNLRRTCKLPAFKGRLLEASDISVHRQTCLSK